MDLSDSQRISIQTHLSQLAEVSFLPSVTVLLLTLQLSLLQLTPFSLLSPISLPLTLPAVVRLAFSRKLDFVALQLFDVLPRENCAAILPVAIGMLRRLHDSHRAEGLLRWMGEKYPTEEEACVLAMGDWKRVEQYLKSHDLNTEEKVKRLVSIEFHLGAYDEVLRLAGVSSDEELRQYAICARLCKGESTWMHDDIQQSIIQLTDCHDSFQRERFFFFSLAQLFYSLHSSNRSHALIIGQHTRMELLEDYQNQLHSTHLQTLPQQSFIPLIHMVVWAVTENSKIPMILEWMEKKEKQSEIPSIRRDINLVKHMITTIIEKQQEDYEAHDDLRAIYEHVKELFSNGEKGKAMEMLEELEIEIREAYSRTTGNLELLDLNELNVDCFHLHINWCVPDVTSESFPLFLSCALNRLQLLPRASTLFPVFRSMESLFHRFESPSLDETMIACHVDILIESLTYLPQSSSLDHLCLLHHLLYCISLHQQYSLLFVKRIASIPLLLWLPVLPVLLQYLLSIVGKSKFSSLDQLYIELVTHLLTHPYLAKKSILSLLVNSLEALPCSIQTLLKGKYPQLLHDTIVFKTEIERISGNKYCQLYSLFHGNETPDETQFTSILDSPSNVIYFESLKCRVILISF